MKTVTVKINKVTETKNFATAPISVDYAMNYIITVEHDDGSRTEEAGTTHDSTITFEV